MAKKREVRGKRQAAAPLQGDPPHPGGLSGDEIASVICDVEERFRRQNEFFNRMKLRSRMRIHTFKPTRHSR